MDEEGGMKDMAKLRCICHDKVFPRMQYHNGLLKHYEDIIQDKYKEEFEWKKKYEELERRIRELIR